MSLRSRIGTPRYADVVATLALVVAVGGTTAYAATALPKNSVGTAQLKTNAVVSGKIKSNAITTGKIKNGAVTATKIKPGAIGPVHLATGAVGTGALQDGGITSDDLSVGAVTSNRVATGAIGTDQLAPGAALDSIPTDSIPLGKILGGDKVETKSVGLGAGTCTTISLSVPGALVGDLAVISYFGNTLTPPSNVVMGPAWVPTDEVVQASFCNLGSAITLSAQVRATTFR